MIDVSHATFRYEDLLMDFTLSVAKGRFMAIIGPSGGGKSTLLSLIAGFEPPLSGTIRIDGRDMAGVAPAARPVSMIFQDHNVFAHLDLWTNVALGISPALNLNEPQRDEVSAALKRVGLAGLDKRKPGEVSGGERQRVAIARALVRDKPVLLLDEPFAALGPALRRDMLDLLLALQKERGLSILMVTHQPEDARYAATETAFLAGGRILAMGPTSNILDNPHLPQIRDYLE